MGLFNLLVPVPVRTELLSNLSAWDVAKLNAVFRGFLDPSERLYYLNPVRDLVWNTNELRALEVYGMRLLLLGDDVSALQQRLEDPEQHIRRYGHNQKLQIYLTGYCPVMHKTTQVRDRTLEFTISGGTADKYSISEDTLQIRRMKARILYNDYSPDTMFIMSFGVSTRLNEHGGTWLQVLDIPDSTVDLRIYVPSFKDRSCGKIQFPRREALRLSRSSLRRARIWSVLVDIVCMCLKIHTVGAAYISSSGLQHVEPHGRMWLEEQIHVCN